MERDDDVQLIHAVLSGDDSASGPHKPLKIQIFRITEP